MIRTIGDLARYTPDQIEEVRSSINLRSYYYSGVRKLGRQAGLTLSEYREWQAKPAEETCRTCHGTGRYKKPQRSVGVVHASSAHMCVRRLFYDVVGQHTPKPEISPELQITFAMGHAIHDIVQKALHIALPEKFRDEVTVDHDEAFIYGSHTDGLVELPQANVLLEIKSIGSEFATLKKPKPEHVTQAVGMYARPLNMPFISFLYVSKSWPHDVKEFVVVYDEGVFRRWWREKGSVLDSALETGVAPVADGSKDDCNMCPYAYMCPQRRK